MFVPKHHTMKAHRRNGGEVHNPGTCLEMSDKLHTLVILPPKKELPVLTG